MKSQRYLSVLSVLISIGGLVQLAPAQDMVGKRDSVNSILLKEKRVIQVILPKTYKPGSTDTYDVLYVLDGNWNIKIVSEVQQFLESEGMIPPTIIVAIFNTDRDRDFTPTYVSSHKTSGGAGNFLSFLQNELIPYVTKSYPSNGNNTLFGHSFGGLFVLHALVNEPQMFQAYIAADPSVWWDKEYVTKEAAVKLGRLANLDKTLFISGRQGQGLVEMGIPPMDTLLKNKAPVGFNWELMTYPAETHGSVKLKSIYDGLKFTYSGYAVKMPEFHPMNGIMLKNRPVKINYFSDTTHVRYTTDGSEPVATSAPMKPQLTLQVPSQLTVKRFTHRKIYDKKTVGNFIIGNSLTPAGKPKHMKAGGFTYSYYEGEWDKLPDFTKLVPLKTGLTDSIFTIDQLPRQNHFALLIEGQLEIKEAGYYLFALITDDGSKLYVGNQLLIDDDGLHRAGDDGKSFIIPLSKGFYPLRLEYFQRKGDSNLRLLYIPPTTHESQKLSKIPFALQYGR